MTLSRPMRQAGSASYITVMPSPCDDTFRDRGQIASATVLSSPKVVMDVAETQRMRITN